MKRYKLLSIVMIAILLSSASCFGSNLANPVAPVPGARVSVGISYNLGGHTITNWEIPALMNRIHARANYSPFRYFNFGVDLGVTQMEVAADTMDTNYVGAFHGNYKFSFGINLKLASPLLKDIIGVVGIAQGTRFESENKSGAMYGGYDAAGAVGLLLHIKNVGYLAAGSKIYLIEGSSHSYNSSEDNFYSNINNIRGWVAFDYFPKIKTIRKYIPYVSFEVSVSPDVEFGEKAPIQEIGFSIAIGSLTLPLYGEGHDEEWHP